MFIIGQPLSFFTPMFKILKILFLLIGFLNIVQAIPAETITFKTGNVVQGKIVERNKESISVDIGNDFSITYFLDEIESISQEQGIAIDTIAVDQEKISSFEDRSQKDGVYKTYFENGDLESEMIYQDGKLDGPLKQYYKNGNLQYEWTFRNHLLEGPLKCYYENGTLQAEAMFQGGQQHGAGKFYDKNGKFWYEEMYKDGKFLDENGEPKTGIFKVHYGDGALAEETSYKNGLRDGISKVYDEGGNLQLEVNFKEGVPINTE